MMGLIGKYKAKVLLSSRGIRLSRWIERNRRSRNHVRKFHQKAQELCFFLAASAASTVSSNFGTPPALRNRDVSGRN